VQKKYLVEKEKNSWLIFRIFLGKNFQALGGHRSQHSRAKMVAEGTKYRKPKRERVNGSPSTVASGVESSMEFPRRNAKRDASSNGGSIHGRRGKDARSRRPSVKVESADGVSPTVFE
jgi:hypothetical protein